MTSMIIISITLALMLLRELNIRMLAVTITLLTTVMAFGKAPDLNGVVLDENGEPMPFVNVVMLTLPDSAFVQGAMTDDQGVFQIVTPKDGALLKVSCIGYQTQYLKAVPGLTIRMKEDALLLSEVVVKSQLPKTRVKGEAMRTTVEGRRGAGYHGLRLRRAHLGAE